METKTIIKTVVVSVLTVSFLATIACSESDTSKKRVAVTPGVTTSAAGLGRTHTVCNDCSSSNYISEAVGSNFEGFFDKFQFRLNFFLVNDANEVGVDGALDIFNLGSVGNCGFVPGNYRVATVNSQFGHLNNDGSVSGVSIEAHSGSEVIRMRVNFASFNGFSTTFIKGCDNRDYPDSLLGQIQIESVNGETCGFNKVLHTGTNHNFSCSR